MNTMTAEDLNQFVEQLVRDAAFGLGIFAIVLVSNAYLLVQIYLWFVKKSASLVNAPPYKLIFLFVASIYVMSLVQLASILVWAVALYANTLIDDLRLALLFAGSSYTTLGIYSDTLPVGWKSVAFYIAFSGLFSFAIATSSMMSMLAMIARRLYKPNAHG
ncbi:MAG: hypothetical protein NBV66_04175 [Burkholderiaceae bacterium]|nr:hypothetical protein [Burkholderiaceae bacterium]